MEMLILSSLEKVFADEKPSAPQYKKFSMLKNERKSFQVAFFCEKSTAVTVEISGKHAEKTNKFIVKDVPVGNATYDDADDFYLRKTSGNYPDCLVPLNGKFNAEGGVWYSVWVEVSPEGEIGESDITVKLKTETDELEESVRIDVIDALLPDKDLVYTNWFH